MVPLGTVSVTAYISVAVDSAATSDVGGGSLRRDFLPLSLLFAIQPVFLVLLVTHVASTDGASN